MGVFGASKWEAYSCSDEFLDQTNGIPYYSSGSRTGNRYKLILKDIKVWVWFDLIQHCGIVYI